MDNFQELHNMELLRTVSDEAYKRNLNAEEVFFVVEEAMRLAIKQRYGNSRLKVSISRKTGSISIFKQIMVVEDDFDVHYIYDKSAGESEDDKENEDVYETVKVSALKKGREEKVGDLISEKLPNVEFGRLAVRSARNTIMVMIKELEQKKQYEKYEDRVGDVVVGSARKIGKGGTVVDLGNAEAYLPGRHMIKGESFKQSDSVKAIILSVKYSEGNCQITLSRTDNEFLVALFKQEVPEIYDGIIHIHSIARDPGSKAKVAVHSSDRNIDPIGACVGIRSSRIQSIIKEINGEKIDIIFYSPELEEFVVNAISPARVIKPIIDSEKKSIDLIVEKDQISLAIGKGGQNVRLASELLGWRIDILNEEDASKKRLKEFSSNTDVLAQALNVEEIIAQLLITENFDSIEKIVNTSATTLSTIEGFDVDIANEILKRAQEYAQKSTEQDDSDLSSLSSLDPDDIKLLRKHAINSLEELADLSISEFYELVPEHNFTDDKVSELIMLSRKKLGWFK